MATTIGLSRDDNGGNIVGRKRPHSPAGGSDSSSTAVVRAGSSVANVEERQCAFCRRGHKEGFAFSRGFVDVLTSESLWASDRPFVYSGKSFWAHTVCVHFSPQTCYDNQNREWCNVNKEYSRSRSLTCTLCGLKGATVGCAHQKCNSSCHFPCGIEDPRRIWTPSQDLNEFPFFCPNHQLERAVHERAREMSRLLDVSQGREATAVPLELPEGCSLVIGRNSKDISLPEDRKALERHLASLPLPRGILSGKRDQVDFKYVSSIVDSKAARVRRGPEREKRCCRCTGPNACRDLSKCECLRDGRNYRLKGRRLDDCHPLRVYECNLNCRCHLDQCRNRLVQRGITCKLMVAHLGPSNRVSSSCGEWGLKAAEDIPLGSFVCTVAGQLVLAKDMENGDKDSILVHRVRDWGRAQVERRMPPPRPRDGNGDGDDHNPGEEEEQEREEDAMLVDQRRFANISRYLRRACHEGDANLLRVAVYTDNQDARAPVLALFTDRTVRKDTELLLSLQPGATAASV